MNKTKIFGWCPGVYQPMEVEDGLLARIRPHLSRLTVSQAFVLCELAENYGNGLVEMTKRSNFQIRGLTNFTYTKFLKGLRDIGLLDENLTMEQKRNVIVTPFWEPYDENYRIANELVERLSEIPILPAKFGFVIDAANQPYLTTASGDIRIERSIDGLVLRADGAALGMRVTVDNAVDSLIEMASWFEENKTSEFRRMKHIVAKNLLPSKWMQTMPLSVTNLPAAGYHRMGQIVSVPRARFKATDLTSLISTYRMSEIRLTPWRMLLFVNGIVRNPDRALKCVYRELAEAQ
ncbi:MAG: cobalamin biosynthesis protein CobG [Aestuariivita sp.]|nr:cobalamin biosynthesis protein CobG [Aestuariivita sp.]